MQAAFLVSNARPTEQVTAYLHLSISSRALQALCLRRLSSDSFSATGALLQDRETAEPASACYSSAKAQILLFRKPSPLCRMPLRIAFWRWSHARNLRNDKRSTQSSRRSLSGWNQEQERSYSCP